MAHAGDRIAPKLVEQAERGSREQSGENEEHVAPAEIIAEHAAGGLAEHLPENLSGQKAAEHLLAALVKDDVADEGEGEGNDPAGGKPAGEPRRHQVRQRGRQAAGHHHGGRERGSDGDAEILAEAVADRPDHQLHRAVRQQIGGDHDRGRADADLEVGGDLRQQRIGRPHHSLGGKARHGQKRDGADGAAAR